VSVNLPTEAEVARAREEVMRALDNRPADMTIAEIAKRSGIPYGTIAQMRVNGSISVARLRKLQQGLIKIGLLK